MARPEGPIGQGTRVGTPQIGTINGPKQAPTSTQIGGDTSIPTTQSTVTQVRGWPRNPAQPILAPGGARGYATTTDHELHTGPAPARVLRQLFSRVFGTIADDGGHGFPYNAEWSLLPHQWVPRAAQRTGPPARGVDDAAIIPAIYAGNARVG